MKLYGVMAEFDTSQRLVEATRRAYEEGYRRMDAYTPLPVEGLAEALGFHRNRLPWIVLMGGIIGGIAGYLMQYSMNAVDYPLNVGGRPLHSWPAFVVITFEMTILGAAVAAVLGMLALNGLPTPYHPVFNVPSFALASRDRFFLCIEAADPKFDPERTREFLRGLRSREVTDVQA